MAKTRSVTAGVILGILLVLLAGGAMAEEPDTAEESDLWQEVLSLVERAKKEGQEIPSDLRRWAEETEALEKARQLYADAVREGREVPVEARQWFETDLRRAVSWEYRVSVVPRQPVDVLQGRLDELGAERWECFHVSEGADAYTLFFKRRPASWLKRVPVGDLVRLLGGVTFGEDSPPGN